MATEGSLRNACLSLERRLRAGEAARCEEYLASSPELAADAEQALDLIYFEYTTRRELGQEARPEEFYQRFPRLRELLERQFGLDELLENSPAPDGEAARGPDGRYRVVGLHARGGIGQVLRAVDTELGREVALKELQPGSEARPNSRERFLREAAITGRLEHPGVVPVYSLGQDPGGRPFYAMRFVEGQTLEQAIDALHAERAAGRRVEFGVGLHKLLRRFVSVCDTIAYAHSRGVIHRDLKPSNILLGPFGETLVVDWGLARAAGPPPGPRDDPAQPGAAGGPQGPDEWAGGLLDLTQTGGVLGTPAFMSPEQARGDGQVGPASDVYGLGATLYALLAGRPPFGGGPVEDLLRQVDDGKVPRPREANRWVPAELEAICLKALAHRPQDRYASPRALAADLESWFADQPVSAVPETPLRRLGRWSRRHRKLATLAVLALAAVAAVTAAAVNRIEAERERAASRVELERDFARRQEGRVALERALALADRNDFGVAMLWMERALEKIPRTAEDAPLRRVLLTNLGEWESRLGRRVRHLFQQGIPSSLALSRDGRLAATGGARGLAYVWDLDQGRHLFSLKTSAPYSLMLAFDPSGECLLTGSRDGGAQLWSLADGSALAVPKEIQESGVTQVAFAPDGDRLAVARTDGTVRLWRRRSGGMAVAVLRGHTAQVTHLAFHPSAALLVTLGEDRTARLWDLVSFQPVGEPLVHEAEPTALAYTPNGRLFVTGERSGAGAVWHGETGALLGRLQHGPGAISTIAVSPNSDYVLTGGGELAVVWSLSGLGTNPGTGQRLRLVGTPYPHPGAGVLSAAFSPDGLTVAVGCYEGDRPDIAHGMVQLWDLRARAPQGERLPHRRSVTHLFFRGKSQLLTAADAAAAVLWEVPSQAPWDAAAGGVRARSFAHSPDGRTFAVGFDDGRLGIHDLRTRKPLGRPMRHDKPVEHVSFSPDGSRLLSVSQTGAFGLWDATTGEAIRALPTRGDPRCASFSGDGSKILTGSSRELRQWDGTTGAPLGEPLDLSVRCLAISPDQARAVAGTEGGTALLVDLKAWRTTHTLAHAGVRSVAFSPDGRWVLVGDNGLVARFWSATTGEPASPELRHLGEVFATRFAPDGQSAATASSEGTVRLWSVPDGRSVSEPMLYPHLPLVVSFSRDGRTLAVGYHGDVVRLWDVSTGLPLGPARRSWGASRNVTFDEEAALLTLARRQLPAPWADDPLLVKARSARATQRRLRPDDRVEWLTEEEVRQAEADLGRPTGPPPGP